ncbi:MAG TPA: biotin/lipoyl-containing protein [Streptosporangiaceae bacterium]|nr:biotin/lipoyl-containing protein [Streptosporangiaceae bacterium]
MRPLSFTEVGEILQLLDRLECDTLDLEYGDLRISLQRAGHASPAAEPAGAAPAPEPAEALPTPGTGGPGTVLAAPLTGTFYRSPAPGDPPFVQPGDDVRAGQTVALIEVMKLFTELKSEVDGAVARIDAEDRSLVEYGQPLLWIEPR